MVGDVLCGVTVGEITTEITRQYHIIDMMLDVRPGDTVTINIIRDGAEMSLSIDITADCLTEY